MRIVEHTNVVKIASERKKIKLVDANRVNQVEMQIEKIHEKTNGFIVFAVKDERWNQWSFKKEEINNSFLQNLLGLDKDVYMSINSFCSPKKLISNIYELNALWSDIDYYKTKYKNKCPEQVIELIMENKLMKKIRPSFFIFSGRGIYAIWLLENANANTCLPLWNKIMDLIDKELKKFGADAKSVEPSHVLRSAGTRNTKTNKLAKIIKEDFKFNPIRYNLGEIAELVLPKLKYSKEEWNEILKKEKKTKKEIGSCKVKSLLNIHSLNYARMSDLQKLIELRSGDCEGYREKIIFLYRYFANCYHKSSEIALEEVKELNTMFNEPLSDREVIKSTKSAEKAAAIWAEKISEYFMIKEKPSIKSFFRATGAYLYSNKRLIEELDISQEEMIELKTIINTKEKNRRNKDYQNEWKKAKYKQKRRNENGLTSRQQAKVDKLYEIEKLLKKGHKQSEIAQIMKITKGTVSKYVKEIKENNKVKEIEENGSTVVTLDRITDTELNLIIS